MTSGDKGFYTCLKLQFEASQKQLAQSQSPESVVGAQLHGYLVSGEYYQEGVLKNCVQLQEGNIPPCPRSFHAAASDPIRKTLYIYGGRTVSVPSQPQDAFRVLNDFWEFRVSDLKWRQIETPASEPMPGRMGATLTCREDMVHVLFGGTGPRGRELCDVQILDMALQQKKWRKFYPSGGVCPRRRSHHFATTMRGGIDLCIYGGVSDGVVLGDCFVLSFATGVWREIRFVEALPPTLGCNVLVVRHYLFVLHDNGKLASVDIHDFERKNELMTWAVLESGCPPELCLTRSHHGLACMGSRILCLGGTRPLAIARHRRLFNRLTEEAYVFNMEDRVWNRVGYPSQICLRTGLSVSALSDDFAFVFGGSLDSDLMCISWNPNIHISRGLRSLQNVAKDAAKHRTSGNCFGISVQQFYDVQKYINPIDFEISQRIRFVLTMWLDRARTRLTMLAGVTELCILCETRRGEVQTLYCGHVLLCHQCFYAEPNRKTCPGCEQRFVRAITIQKKTQAITGSENVQWEKSHRRNTTVKCRAKTPAAPQAPLTILQVVETKGGALSLCGSSHLSSTPDSKTGADDGRLRLLTPHTYRRQKKGRVSLWIEHSPVGKKKHLY